MIGRRFTEDFHRSRLWQAVHGWLGQVRRRRRPVRRSWQGGDPCRSSADHAVYAHYDYEGVIHDYVVEQVRQLAIAGFRVTFVTSARRMRDEMIAQGTP